jgi:hypothetical protein
MVEADYQETQTVNCCNISGELFYLSNISKKFRNTRTRFDINHFFLLHLILQVPTLKKSFSTTK